MVVIFFPSATLTEVEWRLQTFELVDSTQITIEDPTKFTATFGDDGGLGARADCNVCNYVFVESGARLGNSVTVKNGVQVWQGVTAEDGVFLGPNCVLTNDLRPRSRQDFSLSTTVIREGATIGAGAVIRGDLSIGRFAFVGAGSLVTREVPAFAMVWGQPARFRYWISRAAERLDFTDSRTEVTCPSSGYVYRLEDGVVVELGRS